MGELTEAVLCTPRPHDYEDCPSKGSPALEKTHSQENLVGKKFSHGPRNPELPLNLWHQQNRRSGSQV